jgi:hypothetical protein
MNVPGFARLLVVAVMTLLAVTPTFAAKPDTETIPIDVPQYSITECNGFTLLTEVHGRIKVSTYFNKNGDPVKEIVRYSLVQTYTNSESGQSLTLRTAGPDRVTFNADGSITIVSTGRGEVFNSDGELVTFRGRLVTHISADGTETEVFQAGKLQNVCALLD